MKLFELNKNHPLILLKLIIFMLICYMAPNKLSFREPILVPSTEIDKIIGLSSVWIWVYISFYVFIFGMYLFLKNEKSRKILFYAYASSQFCACLIFFAIPTAVLRNDYPIPPETNLSNWALEFIRLADTNLNCMPSTHISLSVIATLTLLGESKKTGALAFSWALLIAYSTLATKQHFLYDVITGATLGFIFWFLTQKIHNSASTIKIESKSVNRS